VKFLREIEMVKQIYIYRNGRISFYITLTKYRRNELDLDQLVSISERNYSDKNKFGIIYHDDFVMYTTLKDIEKGDLSKIMSLNQFIHTYTDGKYNINYDGKVFDYIGGSCYPSAGGREFPGEFSPGNS